MDSVKWTFHPDFWKKNLVFACVELFNIRVLIFYLPPWAFGGSSLFSSWLFLTAYSQFRLCSQNPNTKHCSNSDILSRGHGHFFTHLQWRIHSEYLFHHIPYSLSLIFGSLFSVLSSSSAILLLNDWKFCAKFHIIDRQSALCGTLKNRREK